MHDDDRRLTRLRDLAAQLERLPASAHREWMLGEVRARMVDVDTGYPPQPLRPIREAEPAPATSRPAARRAATAPKPARAARVEPREAAPAREPSHPAGEAAEVRVDEHRTDGDEARDLVDSGPLLSLEDSKDAGPTQAAAGLPAWRRGLRG